MVKAFVAHASGWFHRAHKWGSQTTRLDLRCISWILQTSLDKNIQLSTLRSLAAMATLASFDPALVSTCFDILTGCVSIMSNKVVVPQESEELTAPSVLCYLRTLSHLMIMGPASGIFEDMRRRYVKTFPIQANFKGLPSSHCFCMVHNIFHSNSFDRR